jgi:hypothetical protein
MRGPVTLRPILRKSVEELVPDAMRDEIEPLKVSENMQRLYSNLGHFWEKGEI